MSEPYRTSRIVEFHDTDMAGIMHFSAFFQYMESAEHELVRSLGFSIHGDVAGEVISFPRVHAACDYHAPARCEQQLEIEISVSRLGRSSVTYAFLFSHEGEKIATGQMTSVCCRLVPGQPMVATPLPGEIAEKLGRLQP